MTAEDRSIEITRKFDAENVDAILGKLRGVCNPSEQILGAIVFLARPGYIEDIDAYVRLANEDARRLLDAATVKDERS